MYVKNTSSKRQVVKVRHLTSHQEFDISIQPGGTTEIDNLMKIVSKDHSVQIQDPKSVPSDSLSEVESNPVEESKTDSDVVDEIKTTDNVEEESTEEEETALEETKVDGKFICDECGAEFASARSLSLHKSRAHKHDN